MSTKTHLNLVAAVASHAPQQDKPAPTDVSAADILGSIRRELKAVDVDGLGRVYVYEPVSVAEREAYQKHMRYDEHGLSAPMGGIVDGIIARVRDKAGRKLFVEGNRQRLLDMSADTLLAIWHAIGGDSAKPLSSEMVDAAEKK